MVASKPENNEQIDADILQCKKDVLRARDIMPPYKKTAEEDKSHTTGENTTSPADALETTTDKEKTERIGPIEEKPVSAAEVEQERSEIPRFDLAEEIMAEQRKISATRRKAPGKTFEAHKAEREVEAVGHATWWSTPAQPYQQQIITEIVARDIESLCRGDYSLNSK
ncbi:MAG: hypothetical protein ACYSR5_07975 [Planctomycetota bacterium]|jgi:hypothetical protein